jgi:hypothetical protein
MTHMPASQPHRTAVRSRTLRPALEIIFCGTQVLLLTWRHAPGKLTLPSLSAIAAHSPAGQWLTPIIVTSLMDASSNLVFSTSPLWHTLMPVPGWGGAGRGTIHTFHTLPQRVISPIVPIIYAPNHQLSSQNISQRPMLSQFFVVHLLHTGSQPKECTTHAVEREKNQSR